MIEAQGLVRVTQVPAMAGSQCKCELLTQLPVHITPKQASGLDLLQNRMAKCPREQQNEGILKFPNLSPALSSS